MTILEDIQSNTSEFNITFHMQEVIGAAIFHVFSDKLNREAIEGVMQTKTTPFEMRPFLIGIMFNDFVKDYLAGAFDGGDGGE